MRTTVSCRKLYHSILSITKSDYVSIRLQVECVREVVILFHRAIIMPQIDQHYYTNY